MGGCPGNVKRSANVQVSCGSTTTVSAFSENPTCTYHIKVTSPRCCHQSHGVTHHHHHHQGRHHHHHQGRHHHQKSHTSSRRRRHHHGRRRRWFGRRRHRHRG